MFDPLWGEDEAAWDQGKWSRLSRRQMLRQGPAVLTRLHSLQPAGGASAQTFNFHLKNRIHPSQGWAVMLQGRSLEPEYLGFNPSATIFWL